MLCAFIFSSDLRKAISVSALFKLALILRFSISFARRAK
jgi:hypothetical protein